MKNQIFEISTIIAGIYHILLGVIGLVCPVDTVIRITSVAFGLSLDLTPQLPLIVKFTSVYLFAFGVIMIIISRGGTKYRMLVIPALFLFGIRIVNRIVFFNELIEAGVSPSRNLIGIGLILLFFLAIFLTFPKKNSTIA